MKHLEALQWRYATKKMNGKKVSEDKLERILDAIRLAPSSIGLQPYNVVVVSDPELKKQILPIANNQQQMVDCSHLLIFAAWDNVTETRGNDFVELNARVRNVPAESLGQLKTYLAHFTSRTQEVNFNWAARQAYIGLGFGVAAAALEEVDATPMEGFNAPALDALLGLDTLGLRSVTLLPLGYRDETGDWLAPLAKVRWDKEKLFIRK
jgi:nitroreductase/dihydropteridine reductase